MFPKKKMPVDLPSKLVDKRFVAHFEQFQKTYDECVAEGFEFESDVTRRVTYASTTKIPGGWKNVALRDCVAEVYRLSMGKPPRDATYSAITKYEPAIDVVHAECETIAVILCSEPGLEVMTVDRGGWRAVEPEYSKRGIVLAGAFHPAFPATRYRFRKSVKMCALFTIQAADDKVVDRRLRDWIGRRERVDLTTTDTPPSGLFF